MKLKKTRYSEEKIIGVVKQMEAGRKVPDLTSVTRAAMGVRRQILALTVT